LLIALFLLIEPFVCPVSKSIRPSGIEALDLERIDQFGKDDVDVRREVRRLRDEVKAGKMRRVMVFMEGAHATRMARWFSRTAKIITMEKRTDLVSCCDFDRSSEPHK
jgi:aryl-alcohol dehydrogenase-like predicted oxidoreductase